MFGSLRIGTVRGIPIRLNVSLLLVIGLLIFELGLMGIPAGFLLFGSVLLHELGHALVAQRYGIGIASIDLHLLGGMALMTEQPKTAKQEIWIAAAGPAVSFALGLTFLGLFSLTGGVLALDALLAPGLVELLGYAAVVNLAMGLFNLVPALPMDGGRIFRALLAPKLGHLPATKVAAWVSRFFAATFILIGLFGGVWSLTLIGAMLFVMVGAEERAAKARAAPQWILTEDAQGPVVDVTPVSQQARRQVVFDPFRRRYVIVISEGKI